MELKMPQFGAAMKTGVILNWFKKPGDSFVEGEELCEIQTDKLTNVLEARYDGVIDEIIVQEGEEAPVGAVIAIVTKK